MSLISAPARYNNSPANADPSTLLRASLVYDAMCKVLSDRADQVAWADFSAAEWQLLPHMARSKGWGRCCTDLLR